MYKNCNKSFQGYVNRILIGFSFYLNSNKSWLCYVSSSGSTSRSHVKNCVVDLIATPLPSCSAGSFDCSHCSNPSYVITSAWYKHSKIWCKSSEYKDLKQFKHEPSQQCFILQIKILLKLFWIIAYCLDALVYEPELEERTGLEFLVLL